MKSVDTAAIDGLGLVPATAMTFSTVRRSNPLISAASARASTSTSRGSAAWFSVIVAFAQLFELEFAMRSSCCVLKSVC